MTQSPDLVESDVIRQQAIEALVGLTIEAFAISDTNEDSATYRRITERATAYMRNNLTKSISVTDIARAAGASIRGVQLVFQRAGSGTPLASLRALRVTAAHHALTTATQPTPISHNAQQVGHLNLGGFDAHYLDAFNRFPEDDLSDAARHSAAPH